MYLTVKSEIVMDNLLDSIKEVCKNCLKCKENKREYVKLGKISGNLHVKEPLKHISTDIFGPLKIYVNNKIRKVYVLTFIDRCSRVCLLKKIYEITTDVIIEGVKAWIDKYGSIKSILSDQGKQYTSQKFRDFCKSRNIMGLYTSPYNPTGNSISERLNQTLILAFRLKKEWPVDKILNYAEEGMNNSYHTAIGCIPRAFIERYYNGKERDVVEADMNIINERAFELARINNSRVNKNRKPFKFEVGDLVLVENKVKNKTDPLYIGPFKIIDVKSDGNCYVVENQYKKKVG